MNLRICRRRVVADFSNIHRIEQIVVTAVITMHVNFAIFRQEYLEVKHPYHLLTYRIFEENAGQGQVVVDFEGVIRYHRVNKEVAGRGNGPIDAFFNALRALGLTEYEFVSYSEHAVSTGADSKAVSYIQLRHGEEIVFGVGMDSNISIASIKGIICAINRREARSKQ